MNNLKLNINQWAEDDRPREKMLRKGAESLSDAELLAILIGSGNTDETAVGLMRRVLAAYGNNLNELGKRSVEDLCIFKGIGQAKAITILAACELGKRRRRAELGDRVVIRSSENVYDYFHTKLCDSPVEECWVMLLNHSNKVIDTLCMSRGGLTETSVDIRLILREALLRRATALILCHNHPSGNITPSRQDDLLTERLAEAARVMNISLIDHVVVADSGYYSYGDEGRI